MILLRQLFERESSTYSYLLADPVSREALIIDPVKETFLRDRVLIRELGLKLKYTVETHVHADHITSAGDFRRELSSQSITSTRGGAACADIHVDDGETIVFGNQVLEVRATPGHTLGCLTFVHHGEKMAFTGDALLIRGCGRTDFQFGDARRLYRSVHEKIFTLEHDTVLYPGHDYQGLSCTTVAEEIQFNPRFGEDKSEDDFVAIMRDLHLAYPTKIQESLSANLECGDVGLSPFSAKPHHIPEVTPEWVAQQHALMVLVDVRQPEEFVGELGHVENSINVPLDDLPSFGLTMDKSKPVVVICRSGRRSLTGAQILLELGVEHAASMAGGMIAWNQLGLNQLGLDRLVD